MTNKLQNIVVRMRGGLGNQLFILAFAYWISDQNAGNVPITLDVREYRHFKLRQFELLELIKDDSIRGKMYEQKILSRNQDNLANNNLQD